MIEVEIEDERWTVAVPDAEALTVQAAQASLKSAHPGESRGPGLSSEVLTGQDWVPTFVGLCGGKGGFSGLPGQSLSIRNRSGPAFVLDFDVDHRPCCRAASVS